MNKPLPPEESGQNGAVPDEFSEARIKKILNQSKREAGARDLLTFTFGRAWSVLLILGATFVVVADQFARKTPSDGDGT